MDSRHLAVVNAPHSLSKSIYSHQIRIVRSWMKLKLSPRGAHNECRKRLSMLQLRFHFDWLPAQRSQQRNETRKKPKTQSRSKIAQCTRCVAWRGVGGEQPTSWQWYTLYHYAVCGLLTQSQCKPEQAERQTTRWRPKVEGALHAETDGQRDKQQYWL